MLKKSEKLKTKDFSVVMQGKKIERGQYLDIGYLLSPKTKIAVIISKKTIKKAVDRNKIKRQIFNIYKEIRKDKKINNMFILFYPKKEILYIPYEKTKLVISEMFDKII